MFNKIRENESRVYNKERLAINIKIGINLGSFIIYLKVIQR